MESVILNGSTRESYEVPLPTSPPYLMYMEGGQVARAALNGDIYSVIPAGQGGIFRLYETG